MLLTARTWYAFTPFYLDFVPETSGTYWLGGNNTVIYIGRSTNIRDRLTEHHNTNDPCIRKASQFAIEPCFNYREHEAELLQAFLRQHSRRPTCNIRIP